MMYLAALAVLTTASCSTTEFNNGQTPYQSAEQGKFGYSDQRIETNRFRIMFEGNSRTSRERVEDALLLRAAEVTLENGFDWFQIVERATDPKITTGYSRSPSWAFGGAWGYGPGFATWRSYHPRYGWISYYDPFWASGLFDPFDREVITRFQASAEIVLGKGVKPNDRPDTFDARDVKKNLGGRLIPAPPQTPTQSSPQSPSIPPQATP
ncbi:hypothetical protein PsB1_0671 [Candidatus Phycosocius spiralis]|uniref:DUF4136 domain-containing protein n=2 Tax=Candidatus Phycosocius spiralis TaxID=2815099 RepID=A0ABQ4PU26_9PROT|nr:hypothetical protein PsB1_0671 [Candidatus Phycosocius spiralis]